MKERVLNFVRTAWDSVKSPVGLTVVGAVAGAKANDLFSKNKQSEELKSVKMDRDRLTERVSQLERENGELSILSSTLLARNGELRDELRQRDRTLDMAKSRLSDAAYALDATKNSFRSSWCLWRQPINQKQQVVVDVERASAPTL